MPKTLPIQLLRPSSPTNFVSRRYIIRGEESLFHVMRLVMLTWIHYRSDFATPTFEREQ
jgi:hypothetical protein